VINELFQKKSIPCPTPDGWTRFLTPLRPGLLEELDPLLPGFPRQKTPLPPGFPKNLMSLINLYIQ